MPRYGPMYGPDITYLGVERCTLDEPDTYAGADVVVLGAPFDGSTSHRPGTRFGPQAIRMTDYLPHDATRPSLPLRVDGLADLRVLDAGDVEMFSGDAERSLAALEEAVTTVTRSSAIPLVLGGDHAIAFADAKGVANHHGHGRVSMIHFDAHADTGDIEFGSLYGHGQPMRRLIESGAARGDRFLQIGLRGYWPGPPTLDWMAQQRMRSYEMTEIGARGLTACLDEAFAIAMDGCDGVFLSVDIDVCDPGHAPGTGTPEPGGFSARQLLD
ncbi:MAG: agmatinase family protein, partial [Pseudonocardia sp.]